MRRFDSAHAAIVESSDVQSAIESLRDQYALANVTYHLSQTVADEVDAPFVRTTYPAEWVARYLLKGYVKVDPVATTGFQRTLPFDWRELQPTDDAIPMMEDAARFGIGMSGYSIPVRDKAGRRALVSLTSNLGSASWTEFVEKHLSDLLELAHRVHEKAVIEQYGDVDPVPQLAPREIECLAWAARGKEAPMIAAILNISDNTVRHYLKAARFKLGCSTISQAVAKATRFRIIGE